MKSAYGRLLRAHGKQRMIQIGALSSGLFLLLPVLSSESVQAQAASSSDSAQPEAASAAADDTASPQQMSTVVVTAQRFLAGGDELPPVQPGTGGQLASGGRLGILGEQDAFNVPFSVTSYTDKAIENKQAQTIGDAVRGDPTVQIGSGYANYAQTYHIRGFELTGDDISYGGLYGLLPRQLANPIGASRVEIFKGASAFLNGVSPTGTSVGGSINLEPKRAGDEPLFRTTVGYDTDSHAYTSIDAGRRFGANKEWGARVNALRGSGDSPVKGDDDSRNNAFTLGLDYHGDRLRSSVDLGYERDVQDGTRSGVYMQSATATQPALDKLPSAPSARTNYTPDWNFSRLETTYGMWRGEYDVTDNWTAYAGAGVSKTHEYGRYGSPYLQNSDGAAQVTSRLDTAHDEKHFSYQAGIRGHFDTGYVSHAVNLGFSGALSRDYNAWAFGTAEGDSGDTNINSPSSVAAPDTASVGKPELSGRTRANGVSLSDTAGFLDDKVRLTAGVRYQQLTVRNWSAGENTSNFEEHAYTPMYGIVYQPIQHVSLYANYIQSLQQGPQVPTTALDNSGKSYPNAGQTLGIVRSKQYEAGIKLDYGTIGGAFSAFHIAQPNASGNGTTYGLNGKKKVKGVEASVYGEPVSGWQVMGGVTYLDSDLTGTQGQDGNDAIGVPKYYATLNNTIDVPGVKGLALTGDVIRSGSQFADDDNRYRLKPWTRLDIGARYTSAFAGLPMTWRINLDNVTNNGYWSSANESGYVSMGTPRTLRLSASFDL